uniref:Uncharacterized protein n=1 Tax=Candidatus Methanomethylicus mesodigestus TaxID=1867258 RepID=A0A7C3J4R6_9CREN
MDIDLTNRTLKDVPEKGSAFRILRISENLATKLGVLQRDGEHIFSYKTTTYLDRSFRKIRKRLIDIHF